MTGPHLVQAWRAMRAIDLRAVECIGDIIHPALHERAEVLAEKVALCPAGAFILERAGDPVGYAIAHPWKQGLVPKLDALLVALPGDADCLYLHDVAILAAARGQGAAQELIGSLAGVARRMGLPSLALVSVYGTGVLWEKLGFVDAPCVGDGLATYGRDARYMLRKV